MNQYIMNVKAEKKPRLTSILSMFMDEDETGINYPYDDALVITLKIGSASVNRVLNNTWSSANIILKEMLDSLKFENLKIRSVNTALYRFVESYILSLGSI